jgi:prepilin-type N-terminal cleavage/methylation domain-containing protein
MSRLRNERGMTLVELLAAMAIALIVSLAAFSLIEVVMRRTGEVTARVETTQRARSAMDTMTRELRSQVCVLRADPTLLAAPRSVFAATASSVTFFADTADESFTGGNTTMPIPTLRSLTLSGTTLTEKILPGQNDTVNVGLGAITFADATLERSRELLTDVVLFKDTAGVTLPIFRYYAFDTSTPPQPTLPLNPGSGSLTDAQLQAVAKISIIYRVRSAGKTIDRGSTVLQDDITVRSADPNSNTPKPTCT